ncbi:hypothetical protein CB1_001369001 [Camelus ferus]|nr:hypothetical protein CB1_001369001 [Camelus ferus]
MRALKLILSNGEGVRRVPRRAGPVGSGDTHDVHAGLLEDLSQGTTGVFFLGVLFSAISIATFCTFLVLATTGHHSLPHLNSHSCPSCVWSFISFKWAFLWGLCAQPLLG